MSYADIVATIALLTSLFAIGWHIYTWRHQKKREETPMLKVFILDKERHDDFGKFQKCYYFVIQNVGICGVTVLSCTINGVPIEQYEEFYGSSVTIIGAKIEPENSVLCQWLVNFVLTKVALGSIVRLVYLSDGGKKYEKDFTLSEEME